MSIRGRTFWLSVLFSLALVFAAGGAPSIASTTESGGSEAADWKFHTIVKVDFVQQYAKLPLVENVMIIDSRPYQPKFVKGHIPTAVSIPDTQFDKHVEKLPQDKNAVLIFYCGGPT
jgi:hypothetical protein